MPAAEAGSDLHVLIGGVTATEVDFSQALAGKLPALRGSGRDPCVLAADARRSAAW